MNTFIKYLQILCARSSHIGSFTHTLWHQLVQVTHSLGRHTVCTFCYIFMAQSRKTSIVDQQRSDKRSDKSTNIDKYIKYLESGISLALSFNQFLFPLLCSLCFKVIVHLTYNGLKISLEQTITKCDEEQGNTSKCKQPWCITCIGSNRNR